MKERQVTRGGAPGDVVEANGGHKAAEFYIKRCFGGGNGAVLEIR